jgi:hypothetical protein
VENAPVVGSFQTPVKQEARNSGPLFDVNTSAIFLRDMTFLTQID